MTLKCDREAIDATGQKKNPHLKTIIPKGRHEVERIPNPFGHPNSTWLVLKGTRIGASEGSWRQWQNGVLNDRCEPVDWGELEVIIEE